MAIYRGEGRKEFEEDTKNVDRAVEGSLACRRWQKPLTYMFRRQSMHPSARGRSRCVAGCVRMVTTILEEAKHFRVSRRYRPR